MQSHWYNITIPCCDCKNETSIYRVYYSGDGEIKMLAYCKKCQESVTYKVMASSLAYQAMSNDIMQHLAGEPKAVPLRPPLALPPPQFTSEDRQFEHDCGISEEDVQ